MKKMEDLKMQRITKKSDLEDKENEASEVKKQLGQSQKELAAVQKQVTALETKIETKKSERHSLLQTCKVKKIIRVCLTFFVLESLSLKSLKFK